ncbi:MAG: hypothetical protein ACI82F_004302, partial [Planctomycetota bacterium]
PGDLWGPSEELLFFNGLLDARSGTRRARKQG